MPLPPPIFSFPSGLEPFPVEIVRRANANREMGNLFFEAPLGCLNAWRHFWQVYEEVEGRIFRRVSFAAHQILPFKR